MSQVHPKDAASVPQTCRNRHVSSYQPSHCARHDIIDSGRSGRTVVSFTPFVRAKNGLALLHMVFVFALLGIDGCRTDCDADVGPSKTLSSNETRRKTSTNFNPANIRK